MVIALFVFMIASTAIGAIPVHCIRDAKGKSFFLPGTRSLLYTLLMLYPPTALAEAGNYADHSRRILRFSMYPFIPDVDAAAYEIKARYETEHPDVELRIAINNEYYDKENGILKDQADVYEIDSVFLADFAERLRPIPSDLQPAIASTLPMARAGATYNSTVFGVPHWLCSNFLVSRSTDRALKNVRSLRDVEAAFGYGKQQGLLIDLKGKSTLGEMYLNSILDHYGTVDAARNHIDPLHIDPYPLVQLQRVLAIEPRWQGRDQTWHNLTGAYAREFGAGKGRALVTYSEGLHYALWEARSCRGRRHCGFRSSLQVARWPLADEEGRQVAWVDVLAIDKEATGAKLTDATNLIKMITDHAMYRTLLIPVPGNVPRYLLPARADIYRDKRIVGAAPLYNQFYRYIKNATPITAPGLNDNLRSIGDSLDRSLPSH
jgi:thiamine pyridinylase